MAEHENDVSSPVATDDLKSLLCSSDRDFLIRNTGDEVKVDSLKGKKIGLYFSQLCWDIRQQEFTSILAEAYNELLSNGDFEIIFVSADENDEVFKEYFQKMPWLAIPFSDTKTREALDKLFSIYEIPRLVVLDENSKVLRDDGVDIIKKYGADGFPFTLDRIKELKEYEKAAKRDQSLKSILISRSRDYVIAADGKNMPISKLEGKTIGLYFSLSRYRSIDFIGKLNEVYKKLKEKGEDFEIVTIPLDEYYEKFNQGSQNMTWFSLPVKDKSCQKLEKYFELDTLPTLIIIGPDGKTRHPNVAKAIEEHGVLAYPFTREKIAELEEIEKAKLENQTLESILVSGDRDFVIGKDGVKIPVADLVGKNILLSFSDHEYPRYPRDPRYPPYRPLLPTLVEAYHKIKAKDDAFEIIFISSDRDQASFDNYFSKMPWLALPFGDERKQTLSSIFKVRGIPTLVAIGPTGKTVTTSARSLIMEHGADAYPFTEEHVKEIEAEMVGFVMEMFATEFE